ncbi:uncharacterized protein LOC119179129 isoform X4 [Rhipicephalus microplus]|uniref:uncharacterized protein LOC119179129 isoform X4 n=1 Tax=Rhipicephalus microplus TaxID=6941 RepID=UPI003F6D01A9
MRRKLYFMIVLTYMAVCVMCRRSLRSKVTPQCNIDVKRVKTLLQQKRPIAVTHGFYSEFDYPICVRSRFETFALSGFIHKLSYFEQYPKGSKSRGQRHSLRAFFEVELKQVAILRITGYLARGFEDPRVSGLFDILYAANMCFIVGTKKDEYTYNNNHYTFSPSIPDGKKSSERRGLNAGREQNRESTHTKKQQHLKYT